MAYKAKRRLYLNADRSKIVAEDSPEATFLLAAEGAELSDEDARRYGLSGGKAAESDEDEKAQQRPAETKARKAAPEDKGA